MEELKCKEMIYFVTKISTDYYGCDVYIALEGNGEIKKKLLDLKDR
jgi:hypothetical protein